MNISVPVQRLTFIYLLALMSVVLLSTGAYYSFNRMIETQQYTTERIIVSAEERMLSQRIALQAVRLASTSSAEERDAARSDLQEAAGAMERVRTKLIQDAQTDPSGPATISPQTSIDLDTQISKYLAHTHALLGTPDQAVSLTNPDVVALISTSAPLLESLDVVNATAIRESEAEITRLQMIEVITLGTIIGILALEGVLLCTPLLRHVLSEQRRLIAIQQHLTSVLNHVPIILFACDKTGIITLSSGKGLAALGFKSHEVEGQSIFELYRNEPAALQNVQRVLSGETFQATVSMAGNSFETAYTPLRDRYGALNGFIGVATNTTEHTRAEKALRESEACARRSAEATAESEATVRALYTIASAQHIDFNARVTALLEMGCKRFMLPIGLLSHIEDDRFYVLAASTPDGSIQAGDLFALENNYCSTTVKANEPIGITHAGLSSWSTHPCYAAFLLESYFGTAVIVRGKVYGTLCFSSAIPREQDFTEADKDTLRLMAQWVSGAIEQRLAAEELEEQYRAADRARSESRAVLDSTSEGMMLLASDGTVLTVNKRFIELFGIQSEEIIGAHVHSFENKMRQIFADADAFLAHIDRPLNGNNDQYTDILVQRQPVQRELALFSTAVRMGAGEYRGQLYIFRDVTHERAVDRMKSEFISLVSHELRTPLTSIKGYVDILLDGDVGPIPQEQGEFLTVMKNNANRLVVLINDLLDVAQIESGKVALRYTSVQLSEVVQNVVTLLYPQITAKRQTITVDIDPQLPPIRGDADRMFQIITNLVSNAHKYTPAAGQIHISATKHDDRVQIRVQDSGIGLSAEEQMQLFSRFYRARNRTTQEVGGTGLGLSITRSLVELHGGVIGVTSAPGQGALFSITLPIRQPVPEVEAIHDR